MGGSVMREIKFRGQRTDTKEWVYGNLLKLETDYFTDSNDTGFMWYIIPLKTNGSWSKEKLMLKFISPCFEVIPETVGQYTGRKNKDGKEIYDGDICESMDGIFLVTWNEEKSAFIMVFQDGERLYLEEMWEDTKIIGNINDTPELIKVNNED